MLGNNLLRLKEVHPHPASPHDPLLVARCIEKSNRRPEQRVPRGRGRGREGGFTLLELSIILAIVGILVTVALPSYRQSAQKAREAVLMRDLYTVRDLLDQHRADKGKYPGSLRELVTAGYLRAVPADPFTKSTSTWQEIIESSEGGIYDVHSGSNLVGTTGVPYNQW